MMAGDTYCYRLCKWFCIFTLAVMVAAVLLNYLPKGFFGGYQIVVVSSGSTQRNGPSGLNLQRRLPQCFIIGVRKGGTRALLRFLDLHPKVEAYRGREIHFFDSDKRYRKGFKWYRSRMPFSSEDQITIEKTPAYFHTKNAPMRLKKLNSSALLLLIVRDPVERLISDYTQLLAKNLFNGNGYKSFEEMVFLSDGSVNQRYSPVKFGFYYDYYINWLKFFNQKQILVIDGGTLVTDPLLELKKIETFLGIEHGIGEDQIIFDFEKGFYCPVEKKKLKCLGDSKGRKHFPVSDESKWKLKNFYAQRNQKFCLAVNQTFSWC